MRRTLILAALAVASLGLAAWTIHAAPDARCGASSSESAGPARRAVPRLEHVVVVVMENKGCGDVIGSGRAPFLDRLARRYSFASRYYALTKPSLPNYLGLTGGSTFGISSNCTTCSVGGANLVDQLERAKVSWRAYMEAMPGPCFRGADAGLYAKRHNPFAYFVTVTSRRGRCRNVVPLARLSADIRRGALPRFAWITPDLCHDTHDCPVADGDRFLARLVPGLLRAVGPRGVVFVTWDEGMDASGCCRLAAGGNVALIAAGPAARRGASSGLGYDHYSLLRTVEDAFGLPHLRRAACSCTRSLAPLLR